MKKNIFKYMLVTAMLITAVDVAAQPAANAVAAPASAFVFDVNTVLAIVAIFLFFIIAVLGYTLKSSMDLYKDKHITNKNKNSAGKVLPIIIGLLFFTGLSALAQDAAAPAASGPAHVFSSSNLLRYLLLFIILLEFVAILVFIKWIKFFTGIDRYKEQRAMQAGKPENVLSRLWHRMNKLQPIEEEAALDVGHSYDGIRELDNATPPWFTIAFLATILFGVFYLYRYHVAHSAPNQYEEYENSVTQAKLDVEEYMKKTGGSVDENTVTMQDEAGIATGAKLFAANCAVCHGDKGQGVVGPNLTDKEWLHGCSIQEVFKSIKYGWVANGMKSWKDDFSGAQIADLASYIESIKGTSPAGAKAPQGVDCNAAAAAPAKDSAAAKADSTAKK